MVYIKLLPVSGVHVLAFFSWDVQSITLFSDKIY